LQNVAHNHKAFFILHHAQLLSFFAAKKGRVASFCQLYLMLQVQFYSSG